MAVYIPIILLTVTTNAMAQLLLKTGMVRFHFGFPEGGLIRTVFHVVFSPFVFSGLVVMVVSMGLHLFVLSRVEVSFAYPFLSIAYVLVAVYAHFFLGESMGVARILGIAFICIGTALVAQSG